MENKNYLTIILLILVLGLGGYLIYDKIFTADNETEINQNNSNNNENNQNNNNSNTNQVSNSYETFRNNLIQDRKNSDSDLVFSESVSSTGMIYSINLYDDGNLILHVYSGLNSNKYNNYKIASNVLSFTNVEIGVGGSGVQELYMIKEDGTVSSANVERAIMEKDTKLTIKNNVDNLKNIVSIMEATEYVSSSNSPITDAVGKPVFVDINGNLYY